MTKINRSWSLRIMQLYHSEIIASLFEFEFCYFSSSPSHQCHFASDLRLPFIAKHNNEGKLRMVHLY